MQFVYLRTCVPLQSVVQIKYFLQLDSVFCRNAQKKRKKANREKIKCRQTVLQRANLHFLMFLCVTYFFFFSVRVFFKERSRFTGQRKTEKGTSLTPLYHFRPLNRNLDINCAITAGSPPLHIATSRIRTWNFWFPSASL